MAKQQREARERWYAPTFEEIQKVHDRLHGALEIITPVLQSMERDEAAKVYQDFDGGKSGPELSERLVEWCGKLMAAHAQRPRPVGKPHNK